MFHGRINVSITIVSMARSIRSGPASALSGARDPMAGPTACEATVIAEFMQTVYRELSPNGTIRAAINCGNVTIAHCDEAGALPSGLGIELIDELARRLGRPRTVLTYEGAGLTFEAGMAGEWDLAFLAAHPDRSAALDFTQPYLVHEGSFLVRHDSPLRTVLDLDAEGFVIAVGEGSFHDLHLTRTLQRARLVRAPTLASAVQRFLAGKADAVGGLKLPLAAVAAARSGLRVVEGRYAAVQQALAVPKGHGAALRYLNAFLKDAAVGARVEAAKASWATDARWLLDI
jgi:polar amino acid transport system substrate-binding protein